MHHYISACLPFVLYTLRLSVDHQYCYVPLWNAERGYYVTGAWDDEVMMMLYLLQFTSLPKANETQHFKYFFWVNHFCIWMSILYSFGKYMDTWKDSCLMKTDSRKKLVTDVCNPHTPTSINTISCYIIILKTKGLNFQRNLLFSFSTMGCLKIIVHFSRN